MVLARCANIAISAVLLDLEDPSKVIGRLKAPLLEPPADQVDGYVPNVVYTCGALIQGNRLVLPYGLNDTVTTIVTIELDESIECSWGGGGRRIGVGACRRRRSVSLCSLKRRRSRFAVLRSPFGAN